LKDVVVQEEDKGEQEVGNGYSGLVTEFTITPKGNEMCKSCGKKKKRGQTEMTRKHTPIVSEAQRRLFGGCPVRSTILTGLSKAEARRHLKESKGKKLPERRKKKK